ncbi:MAG: hypothetical protein IPO48_07180 [Saprospiraceae bacterium]|nr:hypothetical protein [Saprospiraceae bacterium]
MRTNISRSVGKSFAFVNNALNKTNTERWSPSVNIDITPLEKTAIYGKFKYFIYDNRIRHQYFQQNQTIINQNYNVDFNTNFCKGWFWNSSLRYSIFKNERFE